MSLKMLVLLKQVPDTNNITGDAMKSDGTVNRAALPAITNPEDLNALEEALKLKESCGGTVVAITLGPPAALKTLKEGLYRGVDDAILVTDPKFAASDTLATSYALQCAIAKVGSYDLIFCGRQAIDGDTAQIGPQVAEKLGINQLSYVTAVIAADTESITIRRAIEGGYEEAVSKFPVLLTITSEANEPRPPSVKRVMIYKNVSCGIGESYSDAYIDVEPGELCSHIKQWNVEDIKADPKLCGLAGSPTKVKNIENVVLTASEAKQIPATEEAISKLMHELVAEHIIG